MPPNEAIYIDELFASSFSGDGTDDLNSQSNLFILIVAHDITQNPQVIRKCAESASQINLLRAGEPM